MRAVTFPHTGEVIVAERDRPTFAADQVLVRVSGAGVNRGDLLQRDGLYPAPPGSPPDIPGLEFAGVVEEAGPEVMRFKPGDRVMGILGGGAQAEYVRLREDACMPIPAELDLVAAAALPEAQLTAFEALVNQGSVFPGAVVYVNAAASGVGTAVVQLASALGATTVGSTRTESKLARLTAIGLDHPVRFFPDSSVAEQSAAIREAAGEVDLAIDLLGGPPLLAAMATLRPGGRAVTLGVIAGTQTAIDLVQMITKRLTLRATSLRARTDAEKAVLTTDYERFVFPYVTRGVISPVLDGVFSFAEVTKAHSALERGETFGKIVLVPDGTSRNMPS